MRRLANKGGSVKVVKKPRTKAERDIDRDEVLDESHEILKMAKEKMMELLAPPPVMSPRPPLLTPPSTFTSAVPGGLLVTLDWVCLLSRTYMHVFDSATNTIKLHLYEQSVIELDHTQSKALLQWIKDSGQADHHNPYLPGGRYPKALMEHPAVVALLADKEVVV
jgi:hypothetical protein